MRKLVFLAAGMICLSAHSFAGQPAPTQYNTYDGQAPGARPLAMGFAFTAVAEGPETLYYNPAGLVSIDKSLFSFSYEVMRQSALSFNDLYNSDNLKNISLNFISLSTAKGALSWRPLSDTSVRLTTNAGWSQTEIKMNAYTLSASHKSDENLSTGLNVSYLNGIIANYGIDNSVPFASVSNGNGVSIDFGAVYRTSDLLNLGYTFRNIGGFVWWDDYAQEQLPFSMSGGLAFKLASFMTFAADWDKVYYRDPSVGPIETMHFGVEQNLGKILKIDAGVFGKDLKDEGTVHYTFGIGYTLNGYNLSIALEKYKLALNNANNDVFRYVLSMDLPL